MIPLWLKIAYTLFLCVLVPAYWRMADAGPRNFLWFSDIALLATGAALWLENSLIVSTMAVGVLLPEIFWNVGFFVRLTTGRSITNLSEYMFESRRPLFSRLLSLFHVFLPPLMVWLIYVLGYDERAFVAMVLVSLIVLPVTYAVTEPKHNINWVHGWEGKRPWGLSPRAYLALLMIAFPVVVFLPTHLLLRAIF
ncbi:MAG TPA: hypothetical protein VFS56_05180 [Gemmatimonadaceae bacterium]|nr:hypothetical protein [Gemmatimonadaceae bacterium]